MSFGGGFSKNLNPIVILSMEKTMVAKVISEVKSVFRLKLLKKVASDVLNQI